MRPKSLKNISEHSFWPGCDDIILQPAYEFAADDPGKCDEAPTEPMTNRFQSGNPC
tara:strand:- start:348006 stop:348173 length:168 start_codon:yes stop_codon:yes gene_type:complete